MAVSGQLEGEKCVDAARLYREDLAVSGQPKDSKNHSKFWIIPRGFGGIRTTDGTNFSDRDLIIPRGFGGIRTTFDLILLIIFTIIPRGFGGIRTTNECK